MKIYNFKIRPHADADTIMSDVISQIIIDFVEIECAYMMLNFGKEYPLYKRILKKIGIKIPHRDPIAGVKFIDWQINEAMKDAGVYEESFVENYIKPWEELKKVYEYFKSKKNEQDDENNLVWEDRKAMEKYFKEKASREKKHEKMLIRAVKLRTTHGLWT
jgi:hypothetical protein